MTFPLGSILLVRDYQLPTTRKDKFFIVIGETENEFSLLSMTTSQIYFDSSLIKHGIIKHGEMSVYCFECGRVIGQAGFSFRKNTIVSHRSNIHCFSKEKITKLDIEVLDILVKKELENLIYSFYRSNIANRYKKIFEKILGDICK